MISFSRSETWHGGWRGKQSLTEIRRAGKKIGEISGSESMGNTSMHYQVTGDLGVFRCFSLKEAKDRCRQLERDRNG